MLMFICVLQYLGDGNGAIPNFPEIQFTGSLPGDCTLEDVDTLRYVCVSPGFVCRAVFDFDLDLFSDPFIVSIVRRFWMLYYR